MRFIQLRKAVQMLARRYSVCKFRKYKGSAEQIVQSIVKDCWNGKYFQAGAGHFNDFYARDFGFVVDRLIKMGYKEECKKTIEYAFQKYKEADKITTTIMCGKAVDNFAVGIDSLAFFIRSLKTTKAEFDRKFVNKEVRRYFNLLVAPDGLIKKNTYVSSIRDNYKRSSSCYDNVMLGMLKNDLSSLKLENPLKQFNYIKLIKENFWTGKYFKEDLNSSNLSADANIFPFFCSVFDEKKMLKSVINSILQQKLDKPFPLKYQSKRNCGRELAPMKYFAPNYEGDTIWSNLGLIYLNVVKNADKGLYEEYRKQYAGIIEHYGTLPEVFNPEGTIYKTQFYISDAGMLWSALLINNP